MLKEVKPELLKQHLQDIAELGGLLQRLGINVETMSNNVQADLTTIVSYIPDEGINTCTLPIELFNDMVTGLKEVVRLVKDTRLNNSRRLQLVEAVFNPLMADLAPYLPPEPEPDQREVTIEDMLEREEAKKLFSDKGYTRMA